MSRINETRHTKWHEICKCKYRLDSGICNNKQRWSNDKYRCGCKNWLRKVYVIKDLFGILAIMKVSLINYVMLESI